MFPQQKDVEPYFKAYRTFAKLINHSPMQVHTMCAMEFLFQMLDIQWLNIISVLSPTNNVALYFLVNIIWRLSRSFTELIIVQAPCALCYLSYICWHIFLQPSNAVNSGVIINPWSEVPCRFWRRISKGRSCLCRFCSFKVKFWVFGFL